MARRTGDLGLMGAAALPAPATVWEIAVDTGGTFTDCLAQAPDGSVRRAKVLTHGALRGTIAEPVSRCCLRVRHAWDVSDGFLEGWWLGRPGHPEERAAVRRFESAAGLIELAADPPFDHEPGMLIEVGTGEEAPILAARLVTATPLGRPLPPVRMRLATTLCTNALLERTGIAPVLFITRGFGDLLAIGTQQRPDLFALRIERPPPLHGPVVEVDERLAADGRVIRALCTGRARDDAARALAAGARTAAVALMHSFINPEHERAVGRLLREAGFEHVVCSHELVPLIKLLPRAQTAVVEASLRPIMAGFLARVRGALPGGRVHIMTSAAGLVRSEDARASDCLLSGPAGGVAGAAAAAVASGFPRSISFDMGGTSTDVARYDGRYDYSFEHEVGGITIMAPALAIHTVAAGGGSICDARDRRLIVGPRSAGAVPGPACYGAGGPLTITDVNLLLGRIDPLRFEIPIDRIAAERALQRVLDRVPVSDRPERWETILQGFLDIANEHMADAIAEVSIRQGCDPADYALVAFGGAGGQHACAVARTLGIRTVVMPAEASLLSAAGLRHATFERFVQRQILAPFKEVEPRLDQLFAELVAEAIAQVAAEAGSSDAPRVVRRILEMRLRGQEHAIAVETDTGSSWREAFEGQYHAIYGHRPTMGSEIEVVSARVVAGSTVPRSANPAWSAAPRPDERPRPGSTWFNGAWLTVPWHDRADLATGACVFGPALVLDRRSACIIEPGWRAVVDGSGALVATIREQGGAMQTAPRLELIEIELFTRRLEAIARQMGQMLQRTAVSTNVKERLDFSCAVLDAEGCLLVNAPHIPVHLGAIGLCVRAVARTIQLEPGDVAVTNHPAFGGSHLPDITVVTPVHDRGGVLIGYVANRAHHAEIGGVRPGSMPPDARSLADEGVVIPPMHLLRGGKECFDDVEALLRSGRHPSRAAGDNMADLRAALAANELGRQAVTALAAAHGTAEVRRMMTTMMQRAESLAREAIGGLGGTGFEAVDSLDDGSPIVTSIRIEGDRAIIDFAGSAAQHPGNLNATPAIVHSAVIYVLRLLIGECLPLNEGLMRAVEVRIPPGLLNPAFVDDPAQGPAVAGGNVETSQRLVDVLLRALGRSAASQGTMNNVLFGTDRFGYYETVCGGTGAGPGFDGASAVHSHMTNTRITDAEVIEHRYPVRLERFAIRRGSGGRGLRRGGDGVVREIMFLAPMSLTILSQRRRSGPFGMAGGESGQPGRQFITRADGTMNDLEAIDGCAVRPGDRLTLLTPGGGGYGPPPESR